jgi:hypothetical protein
VRGVDETRRALADTEPGAAPHSDLASSQQKNQARERPPSRCSNLETAVLWGATAAGLQGAAVAAGPALNRAYSGSVDVDAVHVRCNPNATSAIGFCFYYRTAGATG